MLLKTCLMKTVKCLKKWMSLKQIARKKEPIRFTTMQGSIKVIITSINIGKKIFIKGGAIKQEFSIKLKRYYE
jgi:phage protein U